MHWEIAVSLFGVAVTLTNLLTAWMTNRVRLELTQVKLEMSQTREKDREWMEDKFITRAEFDLRFTTLEARIGIKLH